MHLLLVPVFLISCTADDAAALVERLRSDRVEEREEATERLIEMGMDALPELRKAAEDRDVEVAQRARRVLGTLLTPALKEAAPNIETGGDRACLETLLECAENHDLKTEDLDVLAVPALRGASTAEEKDRVVRIVGQRGLRSGLAAVVGLLKDGDVAVVQAALTALGDLGAREAAPDIVPLLDDNREPVRAAALFALADLPASDGELVEVLRAAREETAALRDSARDSGLLSPDDPVFEAHVAGLEASGAWDRRASAWFLVEAAGKETVPALVDALKAESAPARATAAAVLGEIEAREAVPALQRALLDGRSEVRASVVRSLGILRDKDSSPRVRLLLDDRSALVRGAAVEALGRMGERKGLEKFLADPHPFVRGRAAWALGRTDGVAKLLKDASAYVRAWTMRAMGGQLLNDPSSYVRTNAAARSEPRFPELARVAIPSRPLAGTHREILDALAKAAGVSIEVVSSKEVGTWLSARGRIPWWCGPSVSDALEQLMGEGPCDVVCEPGKWRVVPRDELKK